MKCLICEVGNLIPARRTESLRYKNNNLDVHGFCVSSCDRCEACLITPKQAKINQRLMADAERHADGALVGEEIRAVRALMGLNRIEASKVFGGGPNAFSKYERGEIHPSVAVNKLLLLARDIPAVRLKLLISAGFVVEQWHEEKISCPIETIGSAAWLGSIVLQRPSQVPYEVH